MIEFQLNGRQIRESEASPTLPLLHYLRHHLGLVGTKEGCAEGDCGACGLLMLDRDGGCWRAVNSCLLPLASVHGAVLVSIEGLGSSTDLHPAQAALVSHQGSQCGYCTPGVVMSLAEAAHRDDLAEPARLEDQLSGNLCRCTGYRPIRAAAQELAGTHPRDVLVELQERDAGPPAASLRYAAAGQLYLSPRSWAELWELLAAHPRHRFLAGGTDLTLALALEPRSPAAFVDLQALPGLRGTVLEDQHWRIGAGTLLADLEAASLRTLPVIARMLRFFGSRQIKNRATLGGNLCTASPIGDLAPVLLALDAEVLLRSRQGIRALPLEAFFTAYRQTALQPGELLDAVRIPLPPADARMSAFKVSKRREMDISAVAAGLSLRVDESGCMHQVRVAFGGMADRPRRAAAVEAVLEGAPFAAASFARAAAAVAQDFAPISDVRGSAWYRTRVAHNLVLGFYAEWQEGRPPAWQERLTGTIACAEGLRHG